MCVFTAEVEEVAGTRIFARGLGGRQLLVYAMSYAAGSDLAMVLPVPVPPRAAEDSVRFVSLADCPQFFELLQRGFPTRRPVEFGDLLGGFEEEPVLEVHRVGAYEASFVPHPDDFARLDARFRLPVDLGAANPEYRDWGFVVFKLGASSLAEVHPMAFEFPRRDPSRLFFPTLHVHHRRLDPHASFDHELFCQVDPPMHWHLHEWTDSEGPASSFMDDGPGAALLDAQSLCWRARLEGTRENRDTWLGPRQSLPARTASLDR